MRVKVISSFRRRKTISAKEIKGVIHLYLPVGLSEKEETKYVQWAKKRIKAKKGKRELKEKNADQELEKKAWKLNEKYFERKLIWRGIFYSTRQNNRMFGNCDSKNKTIKVSDRLLKMPKFVQDYVLIHELTHLKVSGHGPEFWRLVNRYPKTERARGYLMAVAMID